MPHPTASTLRSLAFGLCTVALAGSAVAQQAPETGTEKLRNHHADVTLDLAPGDVGDMQVAWTIKTDGPVSHRPLVAGDRVLFADWSGHAWAVDAKTAYDAQTGEKVWTSEGHGPVASSLWYENGMLFWGTGVPVRFGGAKDGYGVVAYTAGG